MTELPLARVVPHGVVQEAGAFWLAEQPPLAEPPFVPEQVQVRVLPTEGNAVVLGEPLPHWEYGL